MAGDADAVLGAGGTSATLPLRIAAVFIIMAVSALGCLFPLLVLDLNGRAKFTSNIPLTPSSRNKSDGERVFHGAHAMHLLKSFSAGIILCVGFVHVLAEANETLGELVDFPLAHFVAMLGSIVVLALSQVVDGLVTSMGERGKPPGPSAAAAAGCGVDMVELVRTGTASSLGRVVIAAPESSPSARVPYCFPEEEPHEHHCDDKKIDMQQQQQQPPQQQQQQQQNQQNQQQQQQQQQQHQQSTSSQKQFLLPVSGNGTDSDSSSEQQHAPSPMTMPTCGSRKPVGLHIDTPPPPPIPDTTATITTIKDYPFVSPRPQSSLSTALAARKEFHRQHSSFGTDGGHDHGGGGHNDAVHVVQAFKKHSLVIAYIMEVGIVFHSVLIGIGLGTATSSVSNTRTLLVAISVHQFFEGAGLSTCILEAHLPRKKNAMMFALFSITTSLGIVLGIGISKIYDESSREAALVEGIFNAFAAGILIYLALVDILQEEFNRREVKKHKIWQIQMMMCVLLGAGVMSVIAIWA